MDKRFLVIRRMMMVRLVVSANPADYDRLVFNKPTSVTQHVIANVNTETIRCLLCLGLKHTRNIARNEINL